MTAPQAAELVVDNSRLVPGGCMKIRGDFAHTSFALSVVALVILLVCLHGNDETAESQLLAYGGHNETMAPLWVGIEKGLFRKHGIDPRVLQTRSGPIMMATLASGGAPLVWAAPSSALSATVGGMKLGCFAVGSNKMPRELIEIGRASCRE